MAGAPAASPQGSGEAHGRHPLGGDLQGPVLDVERCAAEGLGREHPRHWRGLGRARRGHLEGLNAPLSEAIHQIGLAAFGLALDLAQDFPGKGNQ